jgi:hypothetical protein
VGSAVAGEHIDELAFCFGNDALVLLLRNLKRKQYEHAAPESCIRSKSATIAF